jgi:hypothetical protein
MEDRCLPPKSLPQPCRQAAARFSSAHPLAAKAMAQRIIQLADGGELWLTSSYTRTPAGYLLQHHGLVPDICTHLLPETLRAARAGRSPSAFTFTNRQRSTGAR